MRAAGGAWSRVFVSYGCEQRPSFDGCGGGVETKGAAQTWQSLHRHMGSAILLRVVDARIQRSSAAHTPQLCNRFFDLVSHTSHNGRRRIHLRPFCARDTSHAAPCGLVLLGSGWESTLLIPANVMEGDVEITYRRGRFSPAAGKPAGRWLLTRRQRDEKGERSSRWSRSLWNVGNGMLHKRVLRAGVTPSVPYGEPCNSKSSITARSWIGGQAAYT